MKCQDRSIIVLWNSASVSSIASIFHDVSDSLILFSSLCVCRIVRTVSALQIVTFVVVGSDLLIKDIALHDGFDSDTVNTHEDVTNGVSDSEENLVKLKTKRIRLHQQA